MATVFAHVMWSPFSFTAWRHLFNTPPWRAATRGAQNGRVGGDTILRAGQGACVEREERRGVERTPPSGKRKRGAHDVSKNRCHSGPKRWPQRKTTKILNPPNFLGGNIFFVGAKVLGGYCIWNLDFASWAFGFCPKTKKQIYGYNSDPAWI